ncbi:ATP-binding protein [Sphingobium sufflavum]|nr:ATP-binding protein [Sphingobium sufflavum]MCE7797975.1 ATP-binding protein [Sphingobium sufflavum]
MIVDGDRDTDSAFLHRIPVLRRMNGARLVLAAEVGTFLALVTTASLTYWLIAGQHSSDKLLTPPIVALLLVVNLVPAITTLVLIGRRIAKRRAAASLVGGDGRLHVRLVAMFSIIASVPTLMVVIFASLLFQYGVQFWFSENARSLLQNASDLARGYYQQNLREVGDETVTMAGDLRDYLTQSKISSPTFAEGYIYQVVTRKLNGSSIIEIGKDGVMRTAATVEDVRPPGDLITPAMVERLRRGETVVVQAKPRLIEAVTLLYPGSNIFLYANRDAEAPAFSQMERAQTVLADYDIFAKQSRQLQLRFNVALFGGTLALVGFAVWVALAVADRVVSPVGELVDAARRVTAGDLSTRVAGPHAPDEIGTLSSAFNRMTQRLEAQTGALVNANSLLDGRRAFIEAVLTGVTAGVVSVDQSGIVKLINSSARAILLPDGSEPEERPLAEISPDLAEVLASGSNGDIIQVRSGSEIRTLAVKVAADVSGHILTFDDITQQLLDQRRAAWSDVARRIAHEIKNPLTPIQLAAERLQRRYAKEINAESDNGTFTRLTQTIVRQVGDLRRIVDEFSSFARMPKPVFRVEAMDDIARHALFLHEVAHPEIRFAFDMEGEDGDMVCDRRQIGQALTNVVKNAVEAIEQCQREPVDGVTGHVGMALSRSDGALTITITDDGVGLPDERNRIIEPYMTTRAKGTGLGLAIVKKIVEEHQGAIRFEDAQGGGARVIIQFDTHRLARLADGDNSNFERGLETADGA